MPSSIGSKVPQLIVGAAALTSLALSTIDAIRTNTSGPNLQSAAILTGDQYFVPSTTSDIPLTFVGQNSVLKWNYPSAGDITHSSGALGFDRYRVTDPGLKAGTGFFLRSGNNRPTTISTNSGGRVNYTSMSWLNTSTATQAVLNLNAHFNKAPVGANDVTCASGPAGFTNSGTSVFGTANTFFFKHKQFQSGSTVTASGNNLPLVIPPNWRVRCWYLVLPGPGIKAQLSIKTEDQYIP